MLTGNSLRALREELDLTAGEVTEHLELPEAYLVAVERGASPVTRSYVAAATRAAIAAAGSRVAS